MTEYYDVEATDKVFAALRRWKKAECKKLHHSYKFGFGRDHLEWLFDRQDISNDLRIRALCGPNGYVVYRAILAKKLSNEQRQDTSAATVPE